MRTPDSLDYTFALVVAIIAVLVFAAAGAVVRFHSRAQTVAPRRHGLLVWHIVSIAGGTAGTWALILLGQLDIMGLLSTPRAFRLAGYTITGSLTFAAIVIIAVSTRRRISQDGAEPTTAEVRRRRSITFRDD